jgi:hypothetical protein
MNLKNDILLLVLCVHLWIIPYTCVGIILNIFNKKK